MVEIYVRYEGQLRCSAKHGPSSTTLATDAPTDNQGKGESFSPTDLVAAALATCMLTTIGLRANKHGWSVDGIEVQIEKHMTKEPPRRIERLPVRFSVPASVTRALSPEAKRELEQAAKTCPVALSLHANVEVTTSFDW
jgi:uncharacterized OsmC-like protein